jgi:hypothetical protein
MGFLDDIRGRIKRAYWATVEKPGDGRPIRLSKRVRLTNDDDFSGLSPFAYLSAPNEDLEFTNLEEFKDLSLDDKLRLLAHISPEAARAYWDFVIFVGHKFTVTVHRPNDEAAIDARGTAAIAAFIGQLDDLHDSHLTLIHRVIAAGFVRGAFAAELVLDKNGRLPIDLATPDPAVLDFRRATDEARGQVWELGQWQGGIWTSLTDVPTVKYVPILPMVGSPYALAWIETAVFPALFLLMLLQDLRRVVANQGYDRLDIALDVEKLRSAMPASVASDPDKFRKWVEDTINEVSTVYSSLEPDDAYVHTDVVAVNAPVGVIGGTGMTTAVDELMQSLERMLVRAFKSIPFLMAARQTTTETQSNREWEAYGAGIGIIQDKLAYLLGSLFTLGLESQGIQAQVKFKFDMLSESEALREAQVQQVQIANAWNMYQYGFLSHDEAAETVTGKPAAGPPVTMTAVPTPANPDETARLLQEVRAARAAIEERVQETAVVFSANGHGHE